MIKIKRAYEAPAASDGRRFLVDRLWPRGIKKDDAKLTEWLKDISPSNDLRKWYSHDPDKWEEFKKRYLRELASKTDQLEMLNKEARGHTITLVYSAKNEEYNNAVALKEILENMG